MIKELFKQFLQKRAYVSLMCYEENFSNNITDFLKTQTILLIGILVFTLTLTKFTEIICQK